MHIYFNYSIKESKINTYGFDDYSIDYGEFAVCHHSSFSCWFCNNTMIIYSDCNIKKDSYIRSITFEIGDPTQICGGQSHARNVSLCSVLY